MLTELTRSATKILRKEGEWPDDAWSVSWTVPREADFGDVATPIALQLAKILKTQPRKLAEILAKGLQAHADVERVEVAGAGYVNVWLKPKALLREARLALEVCQPSPKRKGEAPVIVEYSQPNIAKPLGVHHILTTIIGQAIANMHRHLGYDTVSINHLGDWGTQFGKLFVAMQKWGSGEGPEQLGMDGLLALYVRFHDEAKKDASLEDEARAAFKALEDGDKEMHAFWERVVSVTMQSIQKIYDRLQVSFDFVHGESFYRDRMDPIIQEGKRKGVFTPGEGNALIVEFPEEQKLPPYMIVKGDGATLYSTRDLATVRYRIDTWHPSSTLYVVDVAQELYFRQLFATVQKLGWEVPTLKHIVFGRMRFADKSMSTRKGNILKLEDVLDEAVARATKVIAEHGDTIQTDNRKDLAEMMGVGALVYGILSQNRTQNLVFDWEKMLSFEGNSAPYLQYTHARARSVLRKAGVSAATLPEDASALEQGDRQLLRTLMQIPSCLEDARATYFPHKLATSLYELCQDFNAFYNALPILKAEGLLKNLRLSLTQAAADVLKTCAALLTLRLPEQM